MASTKRVPLLGQEGGQGELRSDRTPSQPPLAPRGGGRHGFTLFELIIVIAIFLVITGTLLVNFRQSRRRDDLRLAALRFAADAERVRSIAVAGGGADASIVEYGVHLDVLQPDRYLLFGDRVRCVTEVGREVCAANGRYDAGANPREELSDGAVRLPSDVTISRLAPAGGPPETLDMLFRPPRGTVTIVPDATEATVTFWHAMTGDTRTVSINRISGRVNVE